MGYTLNFINDDKKTNIQIWVYYNGRCTHFFIKLRDCKQVSSS